MALISLAMKSTPVAAGGSTGLVGVRIGNGTGRGTLELDLAEKALERSMRTESTVDSVKSDEHSAAWAARGKDGIPLTTTG
jgi:hypothetical protein